jgi:hypothetical protein
LERFDETKKDEADGVYNALGLNKFFPEKNTKKLKKKFEKKPSTKALLRTYQNSSRVHVQMQQNKAYCNGF